MLDFHAGNIRHANFSHLLARQRLSSGDSAVENSRCGSPPPRTIRPFSMWAKLSFALSRSTLSTFRRAFSLRALGGVIPEPLSATESALGHLPAIA